MQVLGAALATGGVALACAVCIHGTANTIDWLCWRGHRLANRIRAMHDKQTATMAERWDAEIRA